MLAALLANLLFSFSIICANRSAKLLGGITANFWRTVLATLMLGAWAHAFGKGLHGPALPVFLLSGLVGFGMGDMSLYKALPLLGSRLTMLTLHCLAAPLASLIEWLWLGTKLTMVESLSALVILAGVATALIPIRRPDAPHHAIPPRGILFACLAALGQALGAVFSRKAYL
ncbi:MAG TPA: EamA family transporter, partial [Verrucomicrobiae bacterium]|nr:EamA family transporter [Verrucomicrobiae bacterium]